MPASPQLKIPGRFYCTDDGKLELQILGTFSGAPIELDQTEIPRVLGVTEEGKAVTLENCFYVNRKFNLSGLAVSRIYVSVAFVGCHFEKDERIQFNEIVCFSEATNEWLEFAPIEASVTVAPSRGVTHSFSEPAPLEWNILNGQKLKIRSSWATPGGRKYRDAKIEQKTWVGFEFNKETALENALSFVNRFSHFVSFVIDQTIPLNAIEGYSDSFVEDIGGRKRRVPIRIFYQQDVLTSPNLTLVSDPFPLFSFRFARSRFGGLITAWLDNYDKFNSSFNLYFATKTGRDLYQENRFLMLAQALESLHRHSSNDTCFPPDDYSMLSGLLEKAVPNRFKDWLRSRLAYGNEPSLRQRLKSLFKRFEPVYGDSKKVKGLISRIVDTRNYLTHYDVALGRRCAQEEDIWKLCLSLETLLQLHMATMCGFSADEVIELYKRSQLFSRKIAEI